MSEINRNRNQLQIAYANNNPILSEQQLLANLQTTLPQHLYNLQPPSSRQRFCIDMPITHLKTDQLHIDPSSQPPFSITQRQSQYSQAAQQYTLQTLSSQYTTIIKNMIKLKNFDKEQAMTQMHRIYTKCLEEKIQLKLSSLQTYFLEYSKNYNAQHKKANKLKEQSKYQYQQMQWIILTIDITLNLWKMISENKKTPPKQIGAALKIVRDASSKLLQILKISRNDKNAEPSYFLYLSSQTKNRLILLLIIWAREELSSGNKQEALNICSLCSFSIMHTSSQNELKQSKIFRNIKKFSISKQNRLKLHFLRMKIFNQLNRQKQQMEQIIICEGLLDNYGNNFQANLEKDEQMNFFHQNSKQNNKKFLAFKLEKRKNQILGQKRSMSNSKFTKQGQRNDKQQKSGIKRFKQIRDSIQINHNESKGMQNYFKSRSLKKIRSSSTNNLRRNEYGSKLQSDSAEQTILKKPSKSKLVSLHNQKTIQNSHYQQQDQTDKTHVNRHAIQFQMHKGKAIDQAKPVSAYKSRYLSIHNKNDLNNQKKIKQTYEVTSKKLTKRPMIANNRNKQFEDVLLGLENQLLDGKNLAESKQKLQLANQKYYKQLIIKRPQAKLLSSTNTKNAKNGQPPAHKQFPYSIKLGSIQKAAQQKQTKIEANRDSTISQKNILECVEKIQKQTINKFFFKANQLKRKSKQTQQIEDIMRSEYNIQCEDPIFGSEGTLSNQYTSTNRESTSKQIGEHRPHYHNCQQQYVVQKSEPAFEAVIQNALFPGLSVCKTIKVVIKKMRQLNQNIKLSEKRQKSYFVLTVEIQSQSGIFCIVHKMDESIMLPQLTITENIMQRLDFHSSSIKINKDEAQPEQQLQNEENKNINERIIVYLKDYLSITNKGLGLTLENKKQLDKDNLISSYQFRLLSKFNRIYLEEQFSIPTLFSLQSRFNIDTYYATFKPMSYKNRNQIASNKQGRWDIMNQLQVLYVAIQKNKSSLKRKYKRKSKNKQNLKQIFSKQMVGQKIHNSEVDTPQVLQSAVLDTKQRSSEIVNVIFNKKQNLPNEKARHIENLLVPVMKYVLMQQTLKPMHKLKTIINRQQQALPEQQQSTSQFSQDQEKQQQNKKYGLLQPFIDYQPTSKVKRISTKVYGQVIGKYFMKATNTKNASQTSRSVLPEKVLLSLKYYLIIPSQSQNSQSSALSSHFTTCQSEQLKKSLALNYNYNVIDRFCERFQYQFIMKLNSEDDMSEKSQTYIAKATLFRVKQLYRAGLQKFYLLKFEIKERGARARLSQFIATSYDINKHFHGEQYDLASMLACQSNQKNLSNTDQKLKSCVLKQPEQKCEGTLKLHKTKISNKNVQHDQTNNLNQANLIISQKCVNLSPDSSQHPFLRPDSQSIKNQIQSQICSQPQQKNQQSLHVRSQVRFEPDFNKGKTQNQEYSNDKFKVSQKHKNSDNEPNSKANISKNSGFSYCESGLNFLQKTNNIACLHNPKKNRLSCRQVKYFYELTRKNINQPNDKQDASKEGSYFAQINVADESQNYSKSAVDNIKNDTDQSSDKFKPSKIIINRIRQETQQNNIECNGNSFKLSLGSQKNIALCLKKISERINLYKTQIYTKVGIKPAFISDSKREKKLSENSLYFANKFRFSRNKHSHLFQQFLTPHLDSLQVLFQKTIKIKCDNIFAILTVFKVKNCDEFFVKIYVPQHQKVMSFSFTSSVFEYLQLADLKGIFQIILQLNPQQNLHGRPVLQSQGYFNTQSKDVQLPERPKQQILQKIKHYFVDSVNDNSLSKNGKCHANKIIWNNMLKFFQFERRVLGRQYLHPFLIIKIGGYEAFLKNFTVQQHISVKNYSESNQVRKQYQNKQYLSIIKIEVSLEEKRNGLNFQNDKKHKKSLKRLKNNIFVTPQMLNSANIYESETNKKMVYVNISSSSTNTHQRICFSYYLYELLHLIDKNSDSMATNRANQNSQQSERKKYQVRSQQFKQMVLNYAVLSKMLNFIKNEYAIELQSSKPYFPQIYHDQTIKNLLKYQVDRTLLRNGRQHMKNSEANSMNFPSDGIQKQSIKQGKMFSKLLNDLLSCTLGNIQNSQEADYKYSSQAKKNSQKISLNSPIIRQNSDSVYFLIRKILKRKVFAISSLFFNKNQNKFKLYISSCKKGTVKQFQFPGLQHSMPFIGVIIDRFLQSNRENSYKEISHENGCQFLLAFRNRLRRYHQNAMMLCSI